MALQFHNWYGDNGTSNMSGGPDPSAPDDQLAKPGGNFLPRALNLLATLGTQAYQQAGGAPDSPMRPPSQPISPPQPINDPTQDPVNAATSGQEAMARNRGFHSYDQMLNWARQREVARSPQTIGKGDEPAPQQMPTTVHGMGQQAFAIHPRAIFNWVNDRFKQATGQ